MSFVNQLVLITGATAGIGAATAELFAANGANLALFARSMDKLTQFAAKLQSQYPNIRVHTAEVDVGKAQQVQSAVAHTMQLFDRIDILINNAGLALDAQHPFAEQSLSDIDEMLNTNLHGVLYTTHAVLNAAFLPTKRGTLINLSSITALTPPAPDGGESIYHTTKAALEAFTNVIRNETIHTNIRILTIRPGFVHTLFHKRRYDGSDAKEAETFQGLEELLPEDVASVVVWMCQQPERVSIRAVDVVPTAQRSLHFNDRQWNERNGVVKEEGVTLKEKVVGAINSALGK